jgi:hypothetical protein
MKPSHIAVLLSLPMIILIAFSAHAQVDSLAIAQLRGAALVAAVERTPTADYLDQSEIPGYFTWLRRHKPLFGKCMAVCDIPGASPSCALQGQSPTIAARTQELLNRSAEDAITNARERLRRGQ